MISQLEEQLINPEKKIIRQTNYRVFFFILFTCLFAFYTGFLLGQSFDPPTDENALLTKIICNLLTAFAGILALAVGFLLTKLLQYRQRIYQLENMMDFLRNENCSEDLDTIELVRKQDAKDVEPRDRQADYYGVNEKPVLVYKQINGKFTAGQVMIVKGTVKKNAHRFTINLHSPVMVPFHISIRFDEQAIVCNSFEGGWRTEDRKGNPYKRGDQVEVKIFVTEKNFKIFTNEKKLTEFAHRLPISSITQYSIGGDLEISDVRFEKTKN